MVTAAETTDPSMTLSDLFEAADDDDVSAASTCAGAPESTVLVAVGDRSEQTQVPPLRRVLLRLVATALIVVALVILVGGFISRRIAENQSVHEVGRLTDVLAQSVVQPALTNAMATNTTAAAALDGVVRQRVLSDELVRVKLWSPTGRIVYSDEPRLVGVRFDLDDEARAALREPQVRAQLSDLSAPENRYERGRGTLLEVYRPVWTPNGRPLLFETYFRYDPVSERAGELWRGFAGITVSSIAAIVVLTVPLVWTLVTRARRAHKQREAMLERAMHASQDERRRIAGSLHDGIVQELAAASFAVAGSAHDAEQRGEHDLAARLGEAGQAVRTSIGGMRSLLVDIYPPTLRTAGLLPALRDLGSTVRVPVALDVDEQAAHDLTPELQEVVFRISQECLRNAAAHANAREVQLRLYRDGDAVCLRISDDGSGFDISNSRPQGHFGLSLMEDLARECGAELSVRTAPGRGTAWCLRMPE
jgi:signal transduction histidine kinase